MRVYRTQHGANRRVATFGFIIVLHVVFVWALKAGFVVKAMDMVAPPIVTELFEEQVQEDEPPPPPPPKMDLPPPVEVPPPIVDIALPVESNTTALSNVTDKPLPPPPPPKPVERTVVKVAPRLNPRANQPDSEEYYPPSSKRLGEQGNVVVRSCIDPKGKLVEATIQESSGVARLDEAAIKYARALRYLAGTEDGKAADACFAFRVRFQLKD
ncbi:MAG: hypothetical protein RL026_2610 [Pseudomonadota bacterium]|jgi:protein TonB